MKTRSLWIVVLVFLGSFLVGGILLLISGYAGFGYILILCFGIIALSSQVIITWRRRKYVRWKNTGNNDDDDSLWPRDDRDDKYWRRR